MLRGDFSAVVVIEGPSGTGKTTLMSGLGQRFGCTVIETGMFLRALAWWADRHVVSLPDAVAALASLDRDAAIQLGGRLPASLAAADVLLGDVALGQGAFGAHLAAGLSAASTHDACVTWVHSFAHDLLRGRQAVISGRDVGARALPGAGLLIRLTADAQARARRKRAQLACAGVGGGWRDDFELLDRPAPRSVVIDTSTVAPEVLLDRVARLVETSLGWRPADRWGTGGPWLPCRDHDPLPGDPGVAPSRPVLTVARRRSAAPTR